MEQNQDKAPTQLISTADVEGVTTLDRYGVAHRVEFGIHNTTGNVRVLVQSGTNERAYVMLDRDTATRLFDRVLEKLDPETGEVDDE